MGEENLGEGSVRQVRRGDAARHGRTPTQGERMAPRHLLPRLVPREAETATTLCPGIFAQRCSETSQIDADPEEVCEGGEL